MSNEVIRTLIERKSVRAYTSQAVSAEDRQTILDAARRAPTAGNMMHYSIIEVREQAIKERLVETCDNQPFIARAPLVLLFLADYQRWFDYFRHCGMEQECVARGQTLRRPQEGELFLSCCDTLIAAQNAVIAAEALGLGSCYIGDIMENYEIHRQMFQLPQYVFPLTLLCIGHPTDQQRQRPLTDRFDQEYVVFQDCYRRLPPEELDAMFARRQEAHLRGKTEAADAVSFGQAMYWRKFDSSFSREMTRSVQQILRVWREE